MTLDLKDIKDREEIKDGEERKDPDEISAYPTKEFFIRMLVKDIPLIKVIPDLADNCVDGALRSRGDDGFGDLWVRIELDGASFKIADNCGGIPIDLARDYAFRFGRPPDAQTVPHSIGQFGVGMKRAIFKIGNKFRIESQTQTSHFVVEEDVEKWLRDPNNWTFRFSERQENLDGISEEQIGTTITVTSLHESVASDFENDKFRIRLRDELELKHRNDMDKGLAITLNKLPLEVRPLDILQSDQLKPAVKEREIRINHQKPVYVKIYAGIADSRPQDCGWHIFCNGRLVLEADKTWTTGWGDDNPRYHGQYNRFRGFVFFDCDDPQLLPWNTTKSGVDEDSAIYKDIRAEMRELMRPVIRFLDELKKEKEIGEDKRKGSLARAVASAKPISVTRSDGTPTFLRPQREKKREEEEVSEIRYSKPSHKVNQVKKALGVGSNTKVGEKTFEYFFERECED